MQQAGKKGEGIMEEQFLTTLGAAQRLEKSPETIRYYERTGKLKAIRTLNGQRIFRLSDIEAFERERDAGPKAA